MTTAEILPSSVPLVARNVRMRAGVPWVPIFCANCGADGGWVPEASANFAFYLCVPCAEKWAPLAATMLVPDEVFWASVKDAQLEHDGRELATTEVVESLKDGSHYLAKLAKDRPRVSRR